MLLALFQVTVNFELDFVVRVSACCKYRTRSNCNAWYHEMATGTAHESAIIADFKPECQAGHSVSQAFMERDSLVDAYLPANQAVSKSKSNQKAPATTAAVKTRRPRPPPAQIAPGKVSKLPTKQGQFADAAAI